MDDEGAPNGDFFAAIADAAAALRDARRAADTTPGGHASSLHPVVPPVARRGWYYSQYDDGRIKWAARFDYYLAVIRGGTASWGFVVDWNSDGAPTKTRGVVLELSFDVTKAMLKQEHRDEKQDYIRMAITVALLLFASDPFAIRPFLTGVKGTLDDAASVAYEDELSAVERGVPWELQVKFTYRSINTPLLVSRFLTELMVSFDVKTPDSYEVGPLGHMLQDLIDRKSPRLERLADLTTRHTVRATLVIAASDPVDNSVLGSEDFFEYLPQLITKLDRYQNRPVPRRWRHVVPFRIGKIELQIGRVHVTPRVLPFVNKLMRARIPVSVTALALNFRLIVNPERVLSKFVRAITTGAKDLAVDTGFQTPQKRSSFDRTERPRDTATDTEGQDRRVQIQTLFAAVTGISCVQSLDLTGLLTSCSSPMNREAVWRGLFEGVLTGGKSTKKMVISISVRKPFRAFTDQDAMLIAESAARWHKANPSKTLCVGSVELQVSPADMATVQALMSAFDDVERVTLTFNKGRSYEVSPSLKPASQDLLLSILRYPSLQRLHIKRVSLPTMDLFNTSIMDPRLTEKPALKTLTLTEVQLEEPASLHRFLDQLTQCAGVPNQLAKKLECLELNGFRAIVDLNVFATLDAILTENTTLRQVKVSVDYADYKKAQAIVAKHHGQIFPTLPANESTMVKTRKAAFLSAIQHHHSTNQAASARFQLDAAMVTRIFDFCATPAFRTAVLDFF